jgi:hypothetical protein
MEEIPSQNLVKEVSAGPSVFTQPAFYKPLIFDALGVLSALGVGFVYRQYLAGEFGYLPLFIAAMVFTVISVLQVFFTKEFDRRFLVLILETVGILVFFTAYGMGVLALAAASVVLLVPWGDASGRSELRSRLEIKFFRAARPSLQKLTTALALLFVILYLPQLSYTNGFVSEENFRYFFNGSAKIVQNFYPEVELTSSVNSLAKSAALQEFQNSVVFQNMPSSDKDTALKQAADQIVKNLGERLGIIISGNETVSKMFYDYIISVLSKLRESSEYWFIIGWAITVFLLLRGIGTIFYWLAGLIAFLVYQILLAADFVHVSGEMATREVLEF